MILKPLLDKIVVAPTKAEEKTAGGIIMPGTTDKKTTQGTVIAVGPGLRKEDGTFTPLTVTAGDTVIFNQYGGTEVKVDGVDYLVLTESSILGVLG